MMYCGSFLIGIPKKRSVSFAVLMLFKGLMEQDPLIAFSHLLYVGEKSQFQDFELDPNMNWFVMYSSTTETVPEKDAKNYLEGYFDNDIVPAVKKLGGVAEHFSFGFFIDDNLKNYVKKNDRGNFSLIILNNGRVSENTIHFLLAEVFSNEDVLAEVYTNKFFLNGQLLVCDNLPTEKKETVEKLLTEVGLRYNIIKNFSNEGVV